MQTTARVLNVFLASPDDVKRERIAAEEVVSDIDKFMGRELGWNVRLHKWEDTPPTAGRPQETINAAVDNCDLFIGLLWERWGEPSGEYSSGFEEEFERVLSRRKETNRPEICLAFKAVEEDKLKDPGPQLLNVIQFQQKVKNQRQVIYGHIKDFDDWKRQLHNWLSLYLLKAHSAVSERLQSPALAPSVESLSGSGTEAIVSLEKSTKVPAQLLDTADGLTQVLKSGRLEFSREEAKLLNEFDIARLFLLSATWMFRRYTGDTLRTHEVNLLYKHRETLKATAGEALQLFRALITDSGSVVPGWYWFEKMDATTLRDSLVSISWRDLSATVRARAVQLLTEGTFRISKAMLSALPINDSDENVRIRVYELLATSGDQRTAAQLEEAATKDDSISAWTAEDAKESLLLRLRPAETAASIIQNAETLTDGQLARLLPVLPELTDPSLLKGLESPISKLREACAAELCRRGKFSDEIAEKLSTDVSVKVREFAFKELANRGKRLDMLQVRKSLSNETSDKPGGVTTLGRLLGGTSQEKGDSDAVALAYYRAQPPNVTLQAVDWFPIEGRLAYKSLALDHYELIEEEIRSDLEEGFSRIKQNSLDRIAEKYGAEAAKKFDDEFKSLDDFIRCQFIEAALLGLVKNGVPSDVVFGRQYISHAYDFVKLPAVELIARFGTAEDSKTLLALSGESWGETRDVAGIAALRLSSNPLDVAVVLTKSKSNKLVQAGFNWLYDQPLTAVGSFFEELINDEDELARLRAVYFFSKKMPRKRLIRLLDAYLERETYYYNVVAWLDRVLYSPRCLKRFFLRELESRATQQA